MYEYQKSGGAAGSLAIMVPQLRDQDLIAPPLVNDPLLGSDSARPVALQRVFERFRFANAAIRIAHHVFDKQVDALQRAWISLLPVEIFLP